MPRVNIEDDLFASGRLSAFAKSLGIEEDSALGKLVFFWRDTQAEGFVAGKREWLVRIVRRRAHDLADKIIDSLIYAGLADNEDDQIFVHGNKDHVSRIKKLRRSASSGGKKRSISASRGTHGEFSPSKSQPLTSHPLVSSPAVSSAPAPAPAPAEDLTKSVCNSTEIVRQPQIDEHTLALEKFYLEKRGRIGQRLTPDERRDLIAIVESARDDAKSAIERFLSDQRKFYQDTKWPLWVCLRDLGQHVGKTSSPNAQKRSPIVERNEELAKEREAIKVDVKRNMEGVKSIISSLSGKMDIKGDLP